MDRLRTLAMQKRCRFLHCCLPGQRRSQKAGRPDHGAHSCILSVGWRQHSRTL